MYRLRRASHTASFIVATVASTTIRLASAAPPAPAPVSPPAAEKCFEDAGLKTVLTVRMHDTAKDDVAGVFESASTREEDAAKQVFAFTGHKGSAPQSSSYHITFADDHRPEPLRKHKQITWKLKPGPQGERLLVNLYGQRLGTKKNASFMFYDVELLPCRTAKAKAP